MAEEGSPEVAVVGSANLDVSVGIDRYPSSGETVLGGELHEGPGGKGLNQAVASARLGRRTAFVVSIGRDTAGDILVQALHEAGVQPLVSWCDRATGRALVLTEPDGESTIVVSPGANAALGGPAVREDADLLRSAGAVLVQMEITAEAVAAAALATEGLLVLNPAPARPIARSVLERVDVLVPNRYELGVLTGRPTPADAEEAAEAAGDLGLAASIVVTLGSGGALVVQQGRRTVVPAVPVQAVDSTGAGDTFCAALVDAMLDGAEAVEAARWAARASAVTVGRRGASESFPTRRELREPG